MFMWTFLLLLNVLVYAAASVAHSAESELPKQRGDAQAASTTITAKRMTVRNQDGQAVFEGSVVLTKGTLVVYSDKMVVRFHASTNGEKTSAGESGSRGTSKNSVPSKKGSDSMPAVSNRSMSQIEATGHVKIVKENGNATSGKAVYSADDEIITLTENPVAWEKGTRVSGKKITMYLKEDRSVVEGGSHLRMEDKESTTP
jgi:lipopolysaccharide export system protein LptA